jgi:CP family cyanate transporter-like MFS transporter
VSAGGTGDTRAVRVGALLGLVLVALSMRNAVAVVGPLFGVISEELALDVVVLSLVGAAPPIGFALAGLVVPSVARRWGLEATLIGALALAAAGQAARAFSTEAVVLVGSTGAVMVGIGALNVLLPPLVRRYFPDRVAGVTSLYLVLLGLSASMPAFTAVQIAEASGWRFALGLWFVLPVLAIVPWVIMLRAHRAVPESPLEETPQAPRAARRVVASPTAWAVTATMSLSSISIYSAFAFLPAMLIAQGVTPAVAGIALGIAMVVGIPEALIVPLLATRSGAVIPMIVVAGLCGVAGWLGMLLAPAVLPYLWAALIGLIPITFPLALVLVNTRTRSQPVTVGLSAFVQGVGYVVAGIFALIVGGVHDVTGSWQAPIILLLATLVLVVPAALILRHDRQVDDEIIRRRSPRPR